MEKILTHVRNSEKRIADISQWNVSDKDKKELKDFLKAYERGEITGRVGTNISATIERTLEYLKPCFIFINQKKTISNLKKEDKTLIQDFVDALLKDKIKSKKEKPYSLKVKKFMLKTFIHYLKWKFPEEHFPLTKVLSIKIHSKLPEPDFLTIQEMEKLFKACSKNSQRFLIAVLFSSGARAEEFYNIRYSDITFPKENETFIKLRIRNDTSKTKGRTISLYWNHCLESVREYIEERLNEGMKPENPVFNVSYNTARDWLYNLGKSVLGKNVHHHLFRSSCATWMSDKLQNKAEYCYFFGWTFSSPMPDIYISRKGINLNPIDEKFKATEIEEIKNQLEKEKFERNRILENNEKMKKQVDNYQDLLIKFTNIMNLLPDEKLKLQLEIQNVK